MAVRLQAEFGVQLQAHVALLLQNVTEVIQIQMPEQTILQQGTTVLHRNSTVEILDVL